MAGCVTNSERRVFSLYDLCTLSRPARCSSEVERSLMVRWVVGSILHGVDPLSYFSFQPVLHDWCNKDRGMCHPVCGMVHIKEPLLLIGKSSLCGGSGFPFSLSEWSLTICLTPYNRKYNVLSASLNKKFLSLSVLCRDQRDVAPCVRSWCDGSDQQKKNDLILCVKRTPGE